MPSAILIQDLTVEYQARSLRQAPVVAVKGLTFEVEEGEVFGFLGPNGAGKTSTLQVLLGFQAPTRGSASIHGVNASVPASRKRVGYLPETATYYKFLTAEELLRFYGRLFGLGGRDLEARITTLLSLVELEAVRKRLLGTYSKGMQQRLGLAQALINDPDILVLDEPANGLDPVGRMQIRELIQRVKREGKTVLFSSHELGEVETVSDRIAIIAAGELKLLGRVEDLVREHRMNLERLFLKVIGCEIPASP